MNISMKKMLVLNTLRMGLFLPKEESSQKTFLIEVLEKLL